MHQGEELAKSSPILSMDFLLPDLCLSYVVPSGSQMEWVTPRVSSWLRGQAVVGRRHRRDRVWLAGKLFPATRRLTGCTSHWIDSRSGWGPVYLEFAPLGDT